jgi:exopolysaccharide biosynthesis polyprenyl glycosylphosphotransferase
MKLHRSYSRGRLVEHGLVILADGLALLSGMLVDEIPMRVALGYAALALIAIDVFDPSRRRLGPRLWLDAPRLAGRLILPVLVLAPLAHSDSEVRVLVLRLPALFGLVLVGRCLSYRVIRSDRARGRHLEPTIIVGAGAVGCRAAGIMKAHPEYGLAPLGFVESVIDSPMPGELPVLGDVWELDKVLAETGARRIVVAFGTTREEELAHIIRTCRPLPVGIYVVPRLFEVGAQAPRDLADEIWGLPLLPLRRGTCSPAWRSKRLFDLAVGSLLLVLTGPGMALIAVAVRVSMGKPVLFRQRRVGQGGRVFELLKFRTLPSIDRSDSEWTAPRDDLKALGRFLRGTGLDEIPQLFNVLRGEMSLVGPRPERPSFVDKFAVEVPNYLDRHRVPVGITGWAQIHGLHGDTSIEDRARFDNYYIENWSAFGDLWILLRTMVSLKHSSKRSGEAAPVLVHGGSPSALNHLPAPPGRLRAAE